MKADSYSTRLPWLAFCSVSLLIVGLSAPTRADIVIRLSVKAVLNPTNGLRQEGVSELNFSNTLAGMNAILAKFGRGYRYEWVGNKLIDVGGLGQFTSGPSQYYDVDFPDASDGDIRRRQFESDAIAHPLIYAWDINAANLYIVRMGGRTTGSSSSYPPDQLTLLLGNPPPGRGYARIATVIHELGHHCNLHHTHAGSRELNVNLTPCTNGCACALLIGGNDDQVADTIPDHECWNSQDEIAQGNYGMNYADLTSARQAAVDRVWFNIMSYHANSPGPGDDLVFTSDQLDRWTDSANQDRTAEVSGLTWFVDGNACSLAPTGSSACTNSFIGGPFPTIARAMNAAGAGDIVLLRPGHYNEPMTITKGITFRATRGDALIGKP